MEGVLTFNEEDIGVKEFIIKESGIRKYIVDASVVLKWYYKKGEEDLEKAETLYELLWSNEDMLMAPELLIYEILNTLRLKKEMTSDDVKAIISNSYKILLLLDMDKKLLEKAFEYSREFNISFYDSIYITLSERYDAPLITADKKLYEACSGFRYKPLLISEIGKI